MNLLLAFLAFNVIVLVHEFGHFIVAKKMGIKVLEFSLFAGPRIFGFKRGETEYNLRLIPVLAYVRLEGEEEDLASPTAFNNKPCGARALTIFAGPFANIILALIIFTIIFSFQGLAVTSVNQVAEDSVAAELGIQKGDVITKYGGKRVYTTLDIVQFLYVSKGKTAEIEYKSGDNKFVKTLSPTIYPAVTAYRIGVVFNSAAGPDSNIVEAISDGYPAKEAGIEPGDRVAKIDGVDVSSRDEVVAYLDESKDKEVAVTLIRNGSEINTSLTPKAEQVAEQYDIGMMFNVEKGGILTSLKQSAVYTYSIIRSTAFSLYWLISGQVDLSQMMGPIGIVTSIGTAVDQEINLMAKAFSLLQMTGFISIAVGATNLIPFPMLDGNKLVLIGIEAIRKKPIKPEWEAKISTVGFVMIIFLALYVAFNDIMRLIVG